MLARMTWDPCLGGCRCAWHCQGGNRGFQGPPCFSLSLTSPFGCWLPPQRVGARSVSGRGVPGTGPGGEVPRGVHVSKGQGRGKKGSLSAVLICCREQACHSGTQPVPIRGLPNSSWAAANGNLKAGLGPAVLPAHPEHQLARVECAAAVS